MWKLILSAVVVFYAVSSAISPLSNPPTISPIMTDREPVEVEETSHPEVEIQAASGRTILFKTGNGAGANGQPSQEIELPYLVLKRNAVLTDPIERTLNISVRGLQVPPSGITVTLTIKTQHGDPDAGGAVGQPIPVWRQSRRIANPTGAVNGTTVDFSIVFEAQVNLQDRVTATPSDYFRVEITTTGDRPPAFDYRQDFAFLMENQWVAELPEVLEEAPGAAPDEMVIYYNDMFPFERDSNDPATRLRREQLDGYLQNELVPAMVAAFRTQTNEWHFPWYASWKGYRPEDGSKLSLALARTGTWFHGPSPQRGDASMTLRVDGGMVEYESLTDGLMATFHHELFHNLQRNIALHESGRGTLKGAVGAWELFVEGTAVMASSVAQSEVEFDQTWGKRAYLFRARKFVGQEGFSGNQMNESYADIDPYSTALYWRFLYERCGGMSPAGEDPAAGMQVIRRTLEVLYSGEVVDISASTDVVVNLARILDVVFAALPDCPFQDFKDSMAQFADAVYRLKLAGGRCQAASMPQGCSLYDPNRLYPEPPVETVSESKPDAETRLPERVVTGNIPNSYGIDFVEISVEPELRGRPITIRFSSLESQPAEFEIRVWKLAALEPEISSGADLVTAGELESLPQAGSSQYSSYTLTAQESRTVERLAFVITRVDDREALNPEGAYRIALQAQ